MSKKYKYKRFHYDRKKISTYILSENEKSARTSGLFKFKFYEIIDVIITELNKR